MPRAPLVLLVLWVASPSPARAQTSTVPLAHWQHSAWIGDRAPPLPIVSSILRTPDGYLWVGSLQGLVRFDGERFTLIDSSTTPSLPSLPIGSYDPLLVDRTGRMWVSDDYRHLRSYADGEFRSEVQDTGYVHSMAEDGTGRLWVGVDATLRVLRNGRFEPAPLPRAVPDTGILELLSDREGGLWIGTLTDGIWHLAGARASHYGTGKLRPMLYDSEGTLWLNNETGTHRGIMRFRDGVFTPVLTSDRRLQIQALAAVEGPDGSVWLPAISAGLIRWRKGVTESYTARDGLSSNSARHVVVGEEGAVWVFTDAGLDRLRPAAFVPVRMDASVPEEASASFALDTAGALWSAVRSNVLYRLEEGMVRRKSGPVKATAFPLNTAGVDLLDILTSTRDGGLWLSPSTDGGLLYFNRSRVQRRYGAREGLPATRAWTAIEAPDGALWLRFFPNGFGRLRDGRFRTFDITEPGPDNMVVDDAGLVWLIPTARKVAFAFRGDSLVREITLPGTTEQLITSVTLEGGDTLWAAGRRYLFRIANGRGTMVEVPAIASILRATTRLAIAGEQLWLASQTGMAALPLSDLHRVADGERVSPVPLFFDQLDGLETPRSKSATRKSLQVAPDGRLWITTPTGFAVTDDSPRALNRIPPIVHIEEVTLNGARLELKDGGFVGPNPERLTFRFAAPSLGVAERVRIEYRLEGADRTWIESPRPRLVHYDHLRPGRYYFQVRAWNESGTPSTSSATLSFTVRAAWYQTALFLTLCVVAIALLGGFLAHLLTRARHRRAAAAVETRYEAVLAERTRLARELHDTLLQGFTGLTLQIDGVRAALEEKNTEQSAALASILARADRTLRDAREMVWDMRKTHDGIGLDAALRQEGDALANPLGVTLEYVVTGAPRALAPTVVATLLRIAREAIANALNHARATKIVVTLAYDAQSVELEVRDDGCGADPRAVETASERGHWGVAGMRERARSVGAALSMTAAPGGGTRVGVQVRAPADPHPAQTG